MKNILLKEIKVQDFKIPGIRKIELNEGLTEIIGDNSTGKSSVADAFAYAFVGTDQWGNSRQEYISKGKNMNNVEVYFESEEGDGSLKKRLVYENENKKTKTYITLNERKATATTVKKLFDSDLFLSIINPRYFQNLTATKAKDILITLADFDNEAVFGKMEIDDVASLDGEKFSIKTIANLKSEKNKVVKFHESEMAIKKAKIEDLELELMFLGIPDEMEEDEDGLDDLINQIHLGLLDVETGKNKIEKVININNNNKLREEKLKKEKEIKGYIQEYKDECDLSVIEINKIKDFNKILDKFKDAYLELVNEVMTDELDKVTLRLKDTTTDGVEKSVFELEYNGKDMKTCSSAEQYKGGLEISRMLMKFTGYSLPVFLDNAESVSGFSEEELADTQVVALSVVKGYKLSKIKDDDTVVDVETLESMPRAKADEFTVHRVVGDFF